ncbi:MAG: LysR family transcriptional regulator [Huintestinicola sp.]
MNSLQVKYFLTLCSERSFSKAAQKLYVTQPSFSQMIKKMESDAGTELIDRSCTPVRLTEAGEAYFNACRQFAAVEEDMRSALSNLSELKNGRLAVGTTSFRASTMLSKSVAAFKNEYGGVDISITEGSVKYLGSAVASGEIDLAICSGEFDDKIFHMEHLSDERLYIAFSPESKANERLEKYRLLAGEICGNSLKLLKTPSCPLKLIEDEPYIRLRHGESIADTCEKIFSEEGITPNTTIYAQSLNTAMSLVMEGIGYAIVPDTMIKYGNMKEHPYYYAVDSRMGTNKICLITRKNRYLSRAAEEYSKILKQLIQSGTWRI